MRSHRVSGKKASKHNSSTFKLMECLWRCSLHKDQGGLSCTHLTGKAHGDPDCGCTKFLTPLKMDSVLVGVSIAEMKHHNKKAS